MIIKIFYEEILILPYHLKTIKVSKEWNGVMPAVFTWLKESPSGTVEIDLEKTKEYAAGILKVQGK